MLKQTIISVTLVAMINLMFAGCATYTKMSVSDVLRSNHKRIGEVTTIDGERIVFDSAGAKYLNDSKSIVGLAQDGTRAQRFTRDLDKVTLVDPTRQDTLPLVLPAAQLVPHLSQKRFDRIVSLVTKQGEQFRFNSLGATIDRPNQTISGMSANLQSARHSLTQSGVTSVSSSHAYGGNPFVYSAVAVPFDSVEYVEVHRGGEAVNWRGLLLAAGIIYTIYSLATVDLMEGWDFQFDSE